MKYELITLKDICINIIDNRGRTCPTTDVGIPLIATNCIKEDNLYPVFEKVRYISDETYENWFRGHPLPNDIIFVLKGSPGRCALVPDPIDFVIAQDMVALRVDDSKAYFWFLFALLRSRRIKHQIENMHVGTMIPHFKKGDFDKLLLPIPSLSKQKKIGDIYKNLSLKIENNRKTCEKLEEIAQAIFKRWFVDFEFPNEEGKPYKSSGGKMVESELGLIPEGWTIKPVFDIAEYINGAAFKSKDFSDTGLPVVKIAELKNGITDTTKYSKKEIDKKYYIDKDELLFSWSGNPKTSIDIFIWKKDKSLLNQHIFKVLPRNEILKAYVYNLLKYLKPEFERTATNKQTTGLGHVTVTDLKRMKIAFPPDGDMIKYQKIAKPKFELFNRYIEINEMLIKIRDALLPKLMSGDVSVED